MEQLAFLAETFGTVILVAAVVAILYAFYRILKTAFSAIKDNDD
jgi:cell division protein FtsW (lipid II flippase)